MTITDRWLCPTRTENALIAPGFGQQAFLHQHSTQVVKKVVQNGEDAHGDQHHLDDECCALAGHYVMSKHATISVSSVETEQAGIWLLIYCIPAGTSATGTKCLTWYQEYSFPRLFVPWNIRSHDGTFVLGTIRSLEHSFPGPFVPWNFRSQDYSFPGAFVPWTVRSMELSFPWNFRSRYPGPFLPLTVRAFVSRAVPGLEQRNKQKRSPMTGGAL